MVASWTCANKPSMTQPRNSNAEVGTRNAELGPARLFRVPRFAFRVGFVAASIPIANRSLPHPASRRGIPVARSIRASAYTVRDVPGDVSAHRAARASAEGRRRVASRARAASIPRPKPTPDGHTGSQPRQPRQRSRCTTTAGSSGASSPASSARMSSMRPRGLSASSPVARNVGHAWRQKPQWTQESSAANPPRASATASTGTVLAFDRDRDRVSGIEGVPQPRDEGAHAFAVGAEVAHGAAQRPGGAFHRKGDLLSGERAAQPPQPVDGRLARPAQGAGAGARRYPLVTYLMLDEVEQVIARVGEPADAEGDRSRGERLRRSHPERVRLVGTQRRELAPGRRPQPGFLGPDEGGGARETHREDPAIA